MNILDVPGRDEALAAQIHLPWRLAYLRWGLLAGLSLAVLAAPVFLEITLPVLPLWGALALMAAFSAITYWRNRRQAPDAAGLALQLAVDMAGLGVVLYLSGGATNPLVSLLLIPVAVAALLLPGKWVVAIALLAVGIYSFLMVHFLPLAVTDMERASHLHLVGMWLTFVISAGMAAWFIARMTASVRARDAQLAAMREQALRDAQVLALGQQAAGAAHELGTPLATMSVLAGELQLDARLPADLRDDLEVMRRQIQACKDIIGGLTARAGIARAEALQSVPLDAWLDALVVRWRTLWPGASCSVIFEGDAPVPSLVAEGGLEQGVVNLLNNAARLSPAGLQLAVAWTAEEVRISVHDRGPGFPPEVLGSAGKAPLPASPGGQGIGLWLTRTAVERRGGRLELENRSSGGVASLILPRDPGRLGGDDR